MTSSVLSKPTTMQVVALCSFALLGCDAPDHLVVNEGTVCVHPDATREGRAANRIEFEVRQCISACRRDEFAECSAKLDGSRIQIESIAGWSRSSAACVALCASLEARCSVEGLAPGSYTVQHGSAVYSLELPTGSTTHCLEDPTYTAS